MSPHICHPDRSGEILPVNLKPLIPVKQSAIPGLNRNFSGDHCVNGNISPLQSR